MKQFMFLCVALLISIPGRSILAMETDLDKIQSVECVVTFSDHISSFIPPKVGDKIVFPLWAMEVWELKFDRTGADVASSYVPIDSNLERVDRSEFRNSHLRTWVGISESFARLSRSEGTLKIISDSAADTIVANYLDFWRSLPDGSWVAGQVVRMSCTPKELW